MTDNAECQRLRREDQPDIMTSSPRDKYFSTYILFYTLGMISQMPSNFFITANSYWMYKFRNTSIPFDPHEKEKKDLQATFTSNFSIVANVVSFAFIIITVKFAKKISVSTRIIGSLCAEMVLFMITIVFVNVNSDSWQYGFYIFTLITGVLLNGSSAVCLISAFQLSSKFPQAYVAAQLTGQSVCGIFAALIQILALTNGIERVIPNAFIYFSTALLAILATLMFYGYKKRYSEFFNYYENLEVQTQNTGLPFSKENVLRVLKKMKFLLFSMIFIQGGTIIIHPGLTANVVSVGEDSKWNTTFFVPVITYLMYNICDFAGREASLRIKQPTNDKILFILSTLRLILIPLLMLCNAQPRHHTSVVFNSDTCYIIFMFIFAITNGYLFNLTITALPSVITLEEKKIGFTVLICVLVVSLACCAMLNSAVLKII
ncbi:equilibrative nucleoside transporter 3 isoform X2 [Aethina tumida]|uniref:equilibrative nucleoside transporter 3 isoform X2 n=1 Tax=Aethina tumida TaxID=116153 RepID=UPI002147D94C|nr:equilibrative nucleoside transporter 3 isoform X2 [Aethina tumida]